MKTTQNVVYDMYVDGSYNTNSNQYGIGILVVEKNTGVVVAEKNLALQKINKNSQLHEWYAFIHGLKFLQNLNIRNAIIYTDTIAIVQIFNGIPLKLNQYIKPVYKQAKKLFDLFDGILSVQYCPSHKGNLYNGRVDQLSKWASGVKQFDPNQSIKGINLRYSPKVSRSIVIQKKKHEKNIINLDTEEGIQYIFLKIKQSNLPIKEQWIPWSNFFDMLHKNIKKDQLSIKLKKLKKSKLFLDSFEILFIGNTLSVKQREK